MIEFILLFALCLIHAAVVVWIVWAWRQDIARWRDALCIKEKIPLVPPPVRARETKMAENAKKWRNGGDGE